MRSLTEPWNRPPFEIPTRGWMMVRLDHALPAVMDLEGWHFRAWKQGKGDPYYLYAPDGTLVGRWEREPSLSDLFDCWRQWKRGG